MPEEFVLLLREGACLCNTKDNNIGANAQEMVAMYREELPFNYIDTIEGKCLLWDEDFINKVLVAMATGSLTNFSDIEKQVWFAFVEFEDGKSNSAPDTYIGAIGCTVPDSNGNSYIVTDSGVTTDLCEKPLSVVQKERQSKSLDEYLMDLYNCAIPNDCGIITGDMQDISPCSI